jgi:hypothetical protein
VFKDSFGSDAGLGLKQRNDAWTIDVEQLDTLLSTSQSACYWLITAHAELLVVPAKVIRGMLNARERIGKTVNVGYNAVRSTAIGLPQFFTDLLIGGWAGDVSHEALEIARGTSKTTRPQLVLEVEVRCGQRRG